MFIFLNSMIFAAMVLTHLTSLTIAAVIICIASVCAIVNAVIEKELKAKAKEFFFSPVLIAFLLITVVFCIVIKGAQPIGNDDFSTWAYLLRAINAYNGYDIPSVVKMFHHPMGLVTY